ncbi:hypothetical protein SADUNF_Sadunf06G0027400 [Salix dunnii]|uniref:Uncharacterized protein n=1 Tax=Salix dunnii TaxID=1413687 RepID=A0A835K701_9ROSI|nr:hypothetical protein SADUNF_Sadunf06G0027400 [Salix dunnii]
MAMPWSMAIWIANMVWVGLIGLVSTCLIVADELASSLRTGDIGPFHYCKGARFSDPCSCKASET